jgi:hypothetical protein
MNTISYPPPHPVKQMAVRAYARKFGCRTLVETGTYLGEMVEAVRNDFDRIITIELHPALYQRAKAFFAPHPHIEVLHGDSGKLMPDVLKTLRGPALFWLDGHWTGGPIPTAKGDKETPIMEELSAVLRHKIRKHVILIDDYRIFARQVDFDSSQYPAVQEVVALVNRLRPDLKIFVENDMFVLHP